MLYSPACWNWSRQLGYVAWMSGLTALNKLKMIKFDPMYEAEVRMVLLC